MVHLLVTVHTGKLYHCWSKYESGRMSLYTFCVLRLLNIHRVAAVTYSHTITEDTRWYYKRLTTYPSLIVDIEFSVVFLDILGTFRFDLYTTDDHINIQKHCPVQHYEQLYNQDLSAPLRLGGYRNYSCLKSQDEYRYCKGKTVIQDFKARNIGFSLGYGCDYSNAASLKGVTFNISVSGQMNKTDCVPLHNRPHLDCVQFYPFASFPNLLGSKQEEARHVGEAFKLGTKKIPGGCYKFQLEMMCYVFVPRCDVTRRVIIPPCRETCWDFVNGCLEAVKEFTQNSNIKTFLNCDYLPTVGSDIKCFSKAVTCDAPPKIPNGNDSEWSHHQWNISSSHTVEHYVC